MKIKCKLFGHKNQYYRSDEEFGRFFRCCKKCGQLQEQKWESNNLIWVSLVKLFDY